VINMITNMINRDDATYCGIIFRHPFFLRTLASLMLALILFLGLAKVNFAQNYLYPVNIIGTVVDVPDNDTGIGIWIVADEDDVVEHSIVVTDETSIPPDSFLRPAVDDVVIIFGFEGDDGSIDALSIFMLEPEIPNFDNDYWDDDSFDFVDDEDSNDEDSDDEDGIEGDFDIEFNTRWKLVSGLITKAPASENGEGRWLIETDSGVEVEAIADPYTDFDESIPLEGDRVIVDGFITLEDIFIIDQVHLPIDGSDIDFYDGAIEELIGIVTAISTAETGIGPEEWTVEIVNDIHTVFVSTNTIFGSNRPSVGERVSVWGYENDFGFIAQEITLDQFGSSEIIVRLKTDTISQTIASRYNLFAESTVLSSGDIYKFASFNPRSQHVQQIVNDMADDSEIIWAERNAVGRLPIEGDRQRSWAWGSADADFENQSAYEQINLALAHSKYLGDGTVIAVLDTGVDLNHPALQPHLIQGWDMVDDDSLPNDEGPGIGWGHGTHVSGILTQVAPNSKIMPIRVLDSNGRGDAFLVAYAIEWAVNHGADVINMSLGVDQYTWVLYNAIQYAAKNGVVVVAAAGNSNTSKAQYPAAFSEVVGVAAVDSNNVKAAFSNHGKWVSMAAPGIGIRSTMVGKNVNGEIVHTYANWSGTSMAAPFVAGAAALIHQKLPTASSTVVATVLRYPNAQSASGETENFAQMEQSIGSLLNIAAAVGIVAPIQNEVGKSNSNIRIYLPAITQ